MKDSIYYSELDTIKAIGHLISEFPSVKLNLCAFYEFVYSKYMFVRGVEEG